MTDVADDPFYSGLDVDPTVFERRRAEPGEHIEPVEIVQTRTCHFKAKVCKACGKPKSNTIHRKKNVQEGKEFCAFRRQNGCVNCGAPKNDPGHLGAPESFNVFASGSWEAYQAAKQRWHVVLAPLLEASGLPLGLKRITVEGIVSFGDQTERDQGNARVVIEKALGDVLVGEGYLPADTWSHYEFGGLQRQENGRNEIRLILFATAPDPPQEPEQGQLL